MKNAEYLLCLLPALPSPATHLYLLLLLELWRAGGRGRREPHTTKGKPRLRLPVLLERQLDLVLGHLQQLSTHQCSQSENAV